MKRENVRDAYDTYSATLSEITRQLSFAGIAIIWIFRTGESSGGIAFSQSLLEPLACFVISLVLDLLQYFYGSVAWSAYNRHQEIKGVGEDASFHAPRCINWPTLGLFYGKAIAVIYGQCVLLKFIFEQL